MKKMYCFIMVLFLVLLVGCQITETVDLKAAKNDITTLLDNLHQASRDKDIDFLKTVFTDDGLCLGTDPEEFWNKEQVIGINLHMFDDESILFDYSIDKREIRVDPDGNSAICVEQFTWNTLSQKIPIRLIHHFIKVDDDWKLDFVSWSLIPLNADLEKLNKALK